MSDKIIYFELNNWFCGRDYPEDEPFISWMKDDGNIKFQDEKWVKQNRLCVVASFVDMSQNYCITTTRKWVEENCPKLLTEFTKFLRYPNEDNETYGQWGHEFLEHKEENIGCFWVEDDDE